MTTPVTGVAPPLADQAARDRIRTALDATLVVEAAAGTGKTSMLVARILALVLSGRAQLATLVAVTFTEKAAGEMKLRLRTEIEAARGRTDLGDAERGRLDLALAQLEVAHIGTIHGFCAEVLRERPIEARVDPLFEMAAEDERDRLYDEAFDGWFQAVLRDPPEGVARVLRRRPRDRQVEGPRGSLRRAGLQLVEQRDFDAPWTRRAVDRHALIDGVLEELGALAALAAEATEPDDWLGKNLTEVARFLEELERRERVQVSRDHDGLEAQLRQLSRKRGWAWAGRGVMYGARLTRAEVRAQRDRVKLRLDEVLAEVDADLAASLREELRPLVSTYEALKGRAGKLDFLDLLLRTRDLLTGDPAVRRALQRRFSHLLIDEFQDTDPLQAEILLLLAARDDDADGDGGLAGGRQVVPGKLFVVGDPKQSIYRFRRADVALYERTKRLLLDQGGELLHLTTSFRAAPALQRLVNDAFSPLMRGGADGSQASYVALEPHRPDAAAQPALVALPVPRPYGDYGKVVHWKIDESLPDAVGAFVDWLVRQSGWTVTERERGDVRVPVEARHVCLLFKRFTSFNEDTTRPYVRALEVRGLPHVLMGGRSYHAREEVLALRNALAAIEWPDDELAIFATLRGPFFAVGDDLLLAYRSHPRLGSLHLLRPVAEEAFRAEDGTLALREVADALALLRELHLHRNRRPIADTLARLLEQTRAHAGVAIWPTGEQALANILRVLDLARRFEAQGATSFRAFVDRMGDDAESGVTAEAPVVEEGTDGVRLMTVHRAKGLEFPVVILVDPTAPATHREPSRHSDPDRRLWATPLCGCTPLDLLEHREAALQRDADESVRVLYVAVTRARELLVVPVVGDEPIEGWLDPLTPVVHPDPPRQRRPGTAAGVPAFRGNDTVLDRPARTFRGPEGAVAPGLHRSRVGGHPVVWWDPTALGLGKDHDAGLRQQKLLEADASGTVSEQGERQHAAWRSQRDQVVERGGHPSLRVRTATEAALSGGVALAVLHEEVRGRQADRPHHKRFGSLVHAILAEVPLQADGPGVQAVAAQQARLLGAPDDEVAAAAGAVAAALAHPLMRRAAASPACRREVNVSLTRDGELIEGVVDLAFEEAGEWFVVDYKTDADIARGGLEVYEAQVSSYAEAVATATGQPSWPILFRL